MTQAANEKTVRAPFDGKILKWMSIPAIPRRLDGKFVIETTDPRTGEMREFPIERTVGSRRMQQYLTKVGDRFVRLPVAYSMEENRWFHLSEAFFSPDGMDYHANTAVWDANCIFCHNVGADPGWNGSKRANPIVGMEGTFDSHVAELGIACEACHGPGEAHLQKWKSVSKPVTLPASRPADASIVNPERLAKDLSTMVCGHCHGQRVPAEEAAIRKIMAKGDPYRPGEDLSKYYKPVTHETRVGEFSFAPRFWKDGSPRLTAYEYQGLLRSKCFTKGNMNCLSCHTMHEGDPHGQLRPDLPGNKLCLQCHHEYEGEKLTAHTHHPEGAPGSSCIACHMPPVVYGVMSWHPTHEIKTPDPVHSAEFKKPDACTVCHTDKSLQWAEARVRDWWPKEGRTTAALAAEFATPEIPRALFAGDAVYRTLAAQRLGLPAPSRRMAKWAVPMLAMALTDEYPNVRRTARNSLVALTGDSSLPQALDPAEARTEAMGRWAHDPVTPAPSARTRMPFDAQGLINTTQTIEWKKMRVEVPVTVGE
ncbi:MAG: hypothetical protein K1X53_14355 [Candidatus Sumerlaeaceae bacterium]|nr:hypothetical protein [Candidatus Sumerlaeaceae bacterium]